MNLQRRQPTAKGPDAWFTGEVFIDPIGQSQGDTPVALGSVHFTPCVWTGWHHHTIGQTLFVTEGEGRFQSRGHKVIAILPGDVIRIAGNEQHWHGAAPDHFMTHLAFTEGDTVWGDPVTEVEYRADPDGHRGAG